MPIITILEIFSPVSFSAAKICSKISAAERLRTLPPIVEAQNAHPMAQPTWVDTHSVLP